MSIKNLLTAGLLGVCATGFIAPPAAAQNVLKIMRGATTSSIKVSVNRAIVMESDQPFAELSVANPGIADIATLSDRTIYVLGKSPGRTTLTLLAADGKLITNVDVHVSPDLAEFKERLREILPREPIEVRTANDGIVLSGRVSGKQKLARALDLAERYAPERVTNLMTVGGSQQVMLKVRFAEMQRSVAKNLSASIGVDITGNSPIAQIGTGSLLQTPTTTGVGVATTGQQGAFSLGFSSGDLAINLMLEALETKGLVRTLAEPNLVAISGNEASFLAGGEFPVPVADGDGITIEYKPFGIELKFKPIVVDGDLINLTIESAVSELDPTQSITVSGSVIPAFSKREATTVVEMRDGQSMSIAGLLQDNFSDAASQVPWLGDVPILGALFRSANYSRDQSELVVIVTPHLVTPVNGDSLSLPTDRVKIPNESELFLLGNVTGNRKGKTVKRATGTVSSQDFTGSYGYVME
ncbi:type II and III secretion system protein family protein [Neptunicoccus cionae]|uniref:General secretion pathway protein n=1 Tax=Neptunicoccus cionae TaxID=2035344 RepID=A0A916VNW2_9RHOB|nr:type II and III secretion system protein family protein [Amylibacter cionae]GGA14226.1 general secretion pathway protein [Amylibacter cionae]